MDWCKNLTGLMLSTAALLAAVPAAHAQDEPTSSYPSRVIRIIVPYAAGGGTDLLARTWAEVLSKDLGQSVIVENRTGGAGVIGTSYAAKAPPDGYTLYIATYGFPVTPLLLKSPQYAVSDFAPIIRTGSSPLALVVGADSPINNVQDLIAAARAKSGELNVGTLGDGSQEQMGAQKFQSMAGVKFTQIPVVGQFHCYKVIHSGTNREEAG
jgi:tripartite-type tricarboxylate transporter receptor subunit TctC